MRADGAATTGVWLNCSWRVESLRLSSSARRAESARRRARERSRQPDSTTIDGATGGSVIRVAGNDCIAECDMPAMTGRVRRIDLQAERVA